MCADAMKILCAPWRDMDAVMLQNGGYRAVILPGFGANCVSLIHLDTGASLLREPPDAPTLRNNPNVYGLPLLFPPNRIRDGTFVFLGKRYTLPINEPARHHHIHGVLSASPFRHAGGGTFVYRARAGEYLGLPFAFTVWRSYLLDEDGLTATVLFQNDGAEPMPLGMGVHAAWKIPFASGDDPARYRLEIPVRRQWLFDPDTIIPTLERLTRSPLLDSLRQGTLCPEAQALSCLMEICPEPVRLTGGVGTFVCQADDALPFLMLWNGGGGQGFVCPEPQSWLVDAPNLNLPPAESGFFALPPGERKSYRLHYSFIPSHRREQL